MGFISPPTKEVNGPCVETGIHESPSREIPIMDGETARHTRSYDPLAVSIP